MEEDYGFKPRGKWGLMNFSWISFLVRVIMEAFFFFLLKLQFSIPFANLADWVLPMARFCPYSSCWLIAGNLNCFWFQNCHLTKIGIIPVNALFSYLEITNLSSWPYFGRIHKSSCLGSLVYSTLFSTFPSNCFPHLLLLTFLGFEWCLKVCRLFLYREF